jgi:hypothetical protein
VCWWTWSHFFWIPACAGMTNFFVRCVATRLDISIPCEPTFGTTFSRALTLTGSLQTRRSGSDPPKAGRNPTFAARDVRRARGRVQQYHIDCNLELIGSFWSCLFKLQSCQAGLLLFQDNDSHIGNHHRFIFFRKTAEVVYHQPGKCFRSVFGDMTVH